MTDEQLFLAFWKKVRSEAKQHDVDVTTNELGHCICWGPMRWLFRLDPGRARSEGHDPQLAEALEKIWISL